MNQIPLRNNKGEVIDYTIVSSEHYEHLNQFKWNKTKDGYVQGTVYKNPWRLHRYIKLEILKKTIPKGYVVDHIDNNPLNNHYKNLRIITLSENARNKKKKDNCSSIYNGVSKQGNIFFVSISIKNKQLNARYDNEIYAAYQYNLWIDEYKLEGATKNVIEIPTDFVKYESRNLLKKLPKGIIYNKNKTRYVQ